MGLLGAAEPSGWTLVVIAFIAAVPPSLVAVLTYLGSRRQVARVETKVDDRADEAKSDIAALEAKTDVVHNQVRTTNGRTLAQVAEDTVTDVDELRGDVMELAIQFARHMGDEHTHETVRRMRQERRDRQETAATLREMAEDDPRAERRRHQRRDEEGD